jgi:hypothetical protein
MTGWAMAGWAAIKPSTLAASENAVVLFMFSLLYGPGRNRPVP